MDFRGGMEVQRQKTLDAIADHNCGYYYEQTTDNFFKIPGSPVAYWVSEGLLSAFATGELLGDIALARNGMKTGENGRFVRLWWEVVIQEFNSTATDWKEASASGAKWFPYNKGGEFRKWYGNNDCIVNWKNKGDEIFNHAKADKRNVQDYPLELKFKPSASWSLVTSGQPAFRYKESNLSDIAGMSFFTKRPELLILLGFCNSKIALEVLKILAPTINFQAGDIGRLPIVDYGVKTGTIRELIINAMVHRSYLDHGMIQVAIYDDRLEITSPGKLPMGQTIERMKEGYSKIRNEALAYAFSYMNLIEHWGSGIPRIIGKVKAAGLREPEFIGGDVDLRINIYRSQRAENSATNNAIMSNKETVSGTEMPDTAEKVPDSADEMPDSSQECRIFKYVLEHGSITTAQAAEVLKVKDRRARTILMDMVEKAYLRKEGAARSTIYVQNTGRG